jgi:hypothetical protein
MIVIIVMIAITHTTHTTHTNTPFNIPSHRVTIPPHTAVQAIRMITSRLITKSMQYQRYNDNCLA